MLKHDYIGLSGYSFLCNRDHLTSFYNDALPDFVPFTQFKKRVKHPLRIAILPNHFGKLCINPFLPNVPF